MKHAPRARIERLPAVHDAAVVPHQQIAGLPLVKPREPILRRVCPKLIEQRLRFRNRKSDEMRLRAAAEEKARASRFGMRAHERMHGTRRLAEIEPRRPGKLP